MMGDHDQHSSGQSPLPSILKQDTSEGSALTPSSFLGLKSTDLNKPSRKSNVDVNNTVNLLISTSCLYRIGNLNRLSIEYRQSKRCIRLRGRSRAASRTSRQVPQV